MILAAVAVMSACSGGSEGPDQTVSSQVAALPEPPMGKVTVKIAWEYGRNIPGEVQVYQPPPGAEGTVWFTMSYPPGTEPLTGDRISDGILVVDPRRPIVVQAVYRNPSDEDVIFWVTPHISDPYRLHNHVLAQCLCIGERYFVPAGGAWSRVISFQLDGRVRAGEKLVITHVLVRGSEE